LWRSTAGAVAVEMAVVAPTFLLFTLGTLEFGRAFYVWNSMERAVEEGGRYAMIYQNGNSSWGPAGNTCTTSLTSCTQAYAQSLMPAGSTVTVTVTSAAATSTYPATITVTATCAFTFAIGSLIPGAAPTLTANATVPLS
jgi:Flp pilus assembly protein TadG